MDPRSAMVVVFDRLGSSYLGPYGNTTFSTPAFNRLAAESLLLDFGFADSPDLARIYRSFWQGSHAFDETNDAPALFARAKEQGLPVVLLTDEPRVARHALAAGCEVELVAAPRQAKSASAPEETQLAQLFYRAIERLAAMESPHLLWVHAASLDREWDAPLEMRERLADEEDPEPLSLVVPPSLHLPPDHDPDERLGLVQAYSAQVILADMCLEILLDAWKEFPLRESTMLAIAGARGFPLGEHGGVGSRSESLHHELLAVPYLFRLPGGEGGATRHPPLVQPADFGATIADWLALPALARPSWGQSLLPLVRDEVPAGLHAAASLTGGEQSLRTPAWFLRSPAAGQEDPHDQPSAELYAKPDDRWEVNEVADRCGEFAEELRAYLARFGEAAARSSRESLPPLPEDLQVRMEC